MYDICLVIVESLLIWWLRWWMKIRLVLTLCTNHLFLWWSLMMCMLCVYWLKVGDIILLLMQFNAISILHQLFTQFIAHLILDHLTLFIIIIGIALFVFTSFIVTLFRRLTSSLIVLYFYFIIVKQSHHVINYRLYLDYTLVAQLLVLIVDLEDLASLVHQMVIVNKLYAVH